MYFDRTRPLMPASPTSTRTREPDGSTLELAKLSSASLHRRRFLSALEIHRRPPPMLVRFSTLGLVVLDEIHFPLRETIRDVVGGSGAYSVFSTVP